MSNGRRAKAAKRRAYVMKSKRIKIAMWRDRGKPVCPNCREPLVDGGHFVPPSFGDRGFFVCVKKVDHD